MTNLPAPTLSITCAVELENALKRELDHLAIPVVKMGRGVVEVAADINTAYQLALSRDPRPSELSDGLSYLNQGGTLTDFCQVLFSLNEFSYVD